MERLFQILSFFAAAVIFISCSASTGDRYEKDEDKPPKKEKTPVKENTPANFEEDFNLTPYRTEIDIEFEEPNIEPMKNIEVWYEYDDADSVSNENRIASNMEGYRVQVLATDNLDEANKLKTELYFKTNQKNVYIIFDPPFYKVKVGDFTTIGEANTLNFKLNQMGYSDSRVVKDTINIYE